MLPASSKANTIAPLPKPQPIVFTKKEIEPGREENGITTNAKLNQCEYQDADQKSNNAFFYGDRFTRAEIINHRYGGDRQQIEQVDAYGKADHVSDEYQPACGAGFIGMGFPF